MQRLRSYLQPALAVVLSAIAGWVAFHHVPKPLPELSRSEFIAEVRQGHVAKVIIEDQEIITGVSSTRGSFRTPFHKTEDGGLARQLRALGVEVMFGKSTRDSFNIGTWSMPLTISILDENTAGERRSAGEFEFVTESITLREMIRLRAQQEVERFNGMETQVFRGLIQPTETERILNGVRARVLLDSEQQCAKAITAFKGNGFLVFLDDRQITDLDETLHLTPQSRVSFLKLVPLIGG